MTHTIKNRGFTLLEVLVAIGIFALFSTMAYGSLTRLLENRERVEAERLFWRELALTFGRMQDDFAFARNRPVRDTDGGPQPRPAFRGEPTDQRALAEPSVEFTRGGATSVGPLPDLQRVGYRLADGVLYRVFWPALDRAPNAQPVSVAMLENVEELNVRFYDKAWVDHWPPLGVASTSPALPRAVEVTLKHRTRGSYTRTFLVRP